MLIVYDEHQEDQDCFCLQPLLSEPVPEETDDEASSCPLIQQVYSLAEEADSAQARGKNI